MNRNDYEVPRARLIDIGAGDARKTGGIVGFAFGLLLTLLQLIWLAIGATQTHTWDEERIGGLEAMLLLIPGFFACGWIWGYFARRSLAWMLPVAVLQGLGFDLMVWMAFRVQEFVRDPDWTPSGIREDYWWQTGGVFGVICLIMGIVVIWRVRRADRKWDVS